MSAQPDDSLRITQADRAEIDAPLRATLRFDPAEPKSGDRLTAIVRSTAGVTFEYDWRIDGRRAGDGSSSLLIPDGAKGKNIEVHVTPRNGTVMGEVVSKGLTVGNHRPLLSSLVVEPATGATILGSVRASARASDADREPVDIRFTWKINGRQIDFRGDSLDPSHFRRGDRIGVEAVAADAESVSDPLRSAEVLIENIPPVITSRPTLLAPDEPFAYAVEVEDPDDRVMRFALLDGPPGMTIDWVSGVVTWNPNGAEPGPQLVQIEADDQHGGRFVQSFSINVAEESPATQPPASSN